MRLVLSVLFLLMFAQHSSAAIVFSIVPTTPGPIELGTSRVFDINIQSDAGTINNLSGVDFFIDANDPTLTGTVTTGGRFTAGTNDFVGGTGYIVPFPSSFQVFGGGTGVGLTLTGVPTKLASITLNTTGAATGSYNLTLSQVAAVDPLFNSLPVVVPAALNYTIQVTGVPEPGSMFLVGSGMAMAAYLRRRRARRLSCQKL